MHKRIVSYVLFLATIIAVILIVIVQPRANKQQKKAMHRNAPFFADTCASADCQKNTEEALAELACSNSGGVWNGSTCQSVASTCDGEACSAITCEMAGYTWDAGTGLCLTGGGSGSSGVSSAPPIIDGVGNNNAVSERIESQCLNHVAQSGYAATLKEYGWFENIRIYAKNACTLAYLATNGKYSSNNDLYSVARLIANDDAKRQEDIGLLYQALEDVPAQKPDQSLDDYLNVKKDGGAKRLKDIMDIMEAFNDATTDQKLNPSYLAEPLPYVLQKKAKVYNESYKTNIVSLEERLHDLLPKPAPVVVKEPEKEKEVKAKEADKPLPIAQKVDEPVQESISTRVVIILNKIVNRLKGIRETGIENGISRKTITPSLGTLQKDFLKTQKIIETFNTCLKEGVC